MKSLIIRRAARAWARTWAWAWAWAWVMLLVIYACACAFLICPAAQAQRSVTLSCTDLYAFIQINFKRSAVSGGPYTLPGSNPSACSFVDSTVTANNTYYYVATATTVGFGETANSNEISATVPANPVPPQNLTATAASGHPFLQWTSTGSATSFNVKSSMTSGGPYNVIGSTSSLNFTDNAALVGVTYYYVVTGVNSVGAESGNSNEASATISGGGGGIPPPTNLTAVVIRPSIQLTWGAPSGVIVTHYRIFRSESCTASYVQKAQTSGQTLYWLDTRAAVGKTYCYQVKDVNNLRQISRPSNTAGPVGVN